MKLLRPDETPEETPPERQYLLPKRVCNKKKIQPHRNKDEKREEMALVRLGIVN